MGLTLHVQTGTRLTSVPYSIYVGRDGAANIDGALGHGESGNQQTFSIQVAQDDVQVAVAELCGAFGWDIPNSYLKRPLPAQHPVFPWLYCTRVTGTRGVISRTQTAFNKKAQGVNFPAFDHVVLQLLFQQPKYGMLSDTVLDTAFPPQSVSVVIQGDTHTTAVVTNLTTTAWMNTNTTVTGSGIPGGTTVQSIDSATQVTLSAAATTSVTRNQLTFTHNVRQEWNRWFFVRPTPASEVLTLEGGKMFWEEGTGAPQPVRGNSFQSPVGQFLSKPDLLATWYQVPYYGLYSPTTGLPEMVMLAQGCVNSQPFLGKPAGTLLLKGYDPQVREAPYPAGYINALPGPTQAGGNSLWPSLTIDLTLQFSFFDPPHPNSAFRGHNLCPNRGVPNVANSGDFNWYLVDSKGDGTHTGTRIYPTFDFRALFAYNF